MGFLDKLKDIFLEKESEEDLVEEIYEKPVFNRVETKWIDADKLREDLERQKAEKKAQKEFENTNFVNLEKQPEVDTVAVQINGAYEFRLEKNLYAERLRVHDIHTDIFDIFIVFHASINCTVDDFNLTIPAHYKIHMAGGTSEEKAYIKLAERTEEEEREFIMDELKPRVINDIKEKISEERYKQIKKQVEEKGKMRFDVVMDIDKDKLTK